MEEQYWTTKTGEKIAVGAMTEDHVRNCLRMVIKRANQIEDDLDHLSGYCNDQFFYKR